MWEMAINSIKLFLTGKLFANPGRAYALFALGILATAAVFIGATKLGLPRLGAAALAGLLGGMFQPRLVRNLKFR